MPKLIGITGPANAGKDTLAALLVQHFGYRRDAFADTVKQVCALLSGEQVENFHDRRLKEEYCPSLRMTRRKAMQVIGTEVGRDMFNPDIWVDALICRWITGGQPDLVVSDVRFDSEALSLRAEGGIIVSISRPAGGLSGEAAQHVSEAGVSPHLIDVYISNAGTIQELLDLAYGVAELAEEHAGER